MKRRMASRVHRTSSRKGSAIVFALVALLVASMLIASLLRTSSMSHRQLLRDEFRIQANWLADAGCERALVRLQNQPDFTEETWNVPAEQLGLERTAVVRLKVTADTANPSQRIVSVVAEYPHGNPDLVRIEREMTAP